MMMTNRSQGVWCAMIGCLLAGAAWAAAGENLLENGGFEEQAGTKPAGWEYYYSGRQYTFCDAQEKHAGAYSLCVIQKEEGKWRQVIAGIEGWEAGAEYELSWWGKTDGVATGQMWVGAHREKNKPGGGTEGAMVARGPFSSKEWTRYSLRFTAPAGWEHLSVRIGQAKASSVGKVWVDEVALVQVGGGTKRPAAPATGNLIGNGDFEFGFDQWTSLHGLVSQTFALDSETRSHGLCSIRTNPATWQKNTLRSYPIAVTNGGEYVFTAMMKGSRAGAKVTLQVRGTGAPWNVNQAAKTDKSVTVTRKTVPLTREWARYEVRTKIPKPYPFPAVAMEILLDAAEGTVWMDDCYFGAGPRQEERAAAEVRGIEVAPLPLGGSFRPGAAAAIRLRAVNVGAEPAGLRVEPRVEDDFRSVVRGEAMALKVAGKSRGEWQAVRLDTSRRGHFKVTLDVSDAQGKAIGTQAVHYAVFSPLKSEGFDDDSFFGICGEWGMDPYYGIAPSYSGEMLSLLRDLGVRWVRDWFPWNGIEPKEGEFVWSHHDPMVKAYREHRLRLIGTITRYYAPKNHWQGGPRFAVPGDQEKFRRSFTEIVKRYRNDVWGWEIWNEPAYFTEAEEYARTVKTAWEAVKSVDPKIKVLGPSLVATHDAAKLAPWMRTVFERAGKQMDVISFHSYHRYLEWFEAENPLPKMLKEMRLAQPAWNTEWGMHSSSPFFADRTDMDVLLTMVSTYLRCISAGQQKYFWFVAVPAAWDGYSVFYDYFVPRPNMVAHAWMAEKLNHAKAAGQCVRGDLEVHRYAAGGGNVAAVWLNGSLEASVEREAMRRIVGGEAEFFDVFGNPLGQSVVISPVPVYAVGKALNEPAEVAAGLESAVKASMAARPQDAFGTITLLTTDVVNLPTEPAEAKHAIGPDGFIRDWLVFGPFANLQRQGWDHDYLKTIVGGEAAGVIPRGLAAGYQFPKDPGGRFEYPGGRVTLRPMEVHESGAKIDLLSRLAPKFNAIGYAGCWIGSDRAQKVKIKVGSDDGCRVWLNHRLLGGRQAERGCRADDDVYEAELKKGGNYLLLKIEQTSGGWAFIVRVTDEKDEPLKAKIGL